MRIATILAAVFLTSASAWATPNIVLIVADDQRADTIDRMSEMSNLAATGVLFVNFFANTPVCGPSRATLLSGRFTHNHGVWYNSAPASFDAFDDSATLATWLKAAGYSTGLFGKYLNGYTCDEATYVPPGWDRWLGYQGGYYNYCMSDNGALIRRGAAEADYSTTVIGDAAVGFLASARRPFFAYVAPFGPHVNSSGDVATPASEDVDRFPNLLPWRPPNFNEEDVSDKPAWVQQLQVTESDGAYADALRRSQLQALLAVNRLVGRIESALGPEAENTAIIYLADNGMSWGAHRWMYKNVAYEEAIRVPLVISYPPLNPAQHRTVRSASMVDIAPTILELAGAPRELDGKSLVPLLRDPAALWSKEVLIEYLHPAISAEGHNSALRTPHLKYGELATGEKELYDLDADPYELNNLAGQAEYQPTVQNMAQRLHDHH